MDATFEYSWRVGSFSIVRGGYCGHVEKYWCSNEEGDSDGWRWSGFATEDVANGLRTHDSPKTSLAEAKRQAEAWIDAQIEREKGLAVYQFAGLEGGVAP